MTNYRDRPVRLEVVRNVLGNVLHAGAGGTIEMVNVLEDLDHGRPRPDWWAWYDWPQWWRHFNGIGRITWKLTLEPGATVDLDYTWDYYWR